MDFNVGKCKVMHLGGKNSRHPYFLGGVRLGMVEEEKDLGVVITSNLKSGGQCKMAYNKAVRILGMINRTITFKDRGILLSLYKTLVRPLLEYSSTASSPHYQKDKMLLKRAQHKFIWMVYGLKHMEYDSND